MQSADLGQRAAGADGDDVFEGIDFVAEAREVFEMGDVGVLIDGDVGASARLAENKFDLLCTVEMNDRDHHAAQSEASDDCDDRFGPVGRLERNDITLTKANPLEGGREAEALDPEVTGAPLEGTRVRPNPEGEFWLASDLAFQEGVESVVGPEAFF